MKLKKLEENKLILSSEDYVFYQLKLSKYTIDNFSDIIENENNHYLHYYEKICDNWTRWVLIFKRK